MIGPEPIIRTDSKSLLLGMVQDREIILDLDIKKRPPSKGSLLKWIFSSFGKALIQEIFPSGGFLGSLAFAVAAAEADSDFLLGGLAGNRALGEITLGLESKLGVLDDLLGTIAAAYADVNSLLGVNGLAGNRAFVIDGLRGLLVCRKSEA